MFDSEEALRKQISLGEDSVLEFKNLEFRGPKVIGPHRDGMADELAAMANSSSGVFILGVDDKTHAILGLPPNRLDDAEEWLRAICNDLISPPLYCRIRKMFLIADDGSERAIIRVDVPKSLGLHKSKNGYFQRYGSSKREMEPHIVERLMLQRSMTRMVRFDERAVMHAPLDCLDDKLWQRFMTPLSPADDHEFLSKLKLITQDEDGNDFPTVAGILLTTHRPQDYMPNAFIQAVAYRGNQPNAAYQLDAKDITGPLDSQIREACTFVARNMRVYGVKEPWRRDIPQYSSQAVFEAIVNAVAHRDYIIESSKIRLRMFDDRLELFSPGSIPNTMTVDSLPLRQVTRNELVASLLARCPVDMADTEIKRRFMMDKRGEGVPIIMTESEKLSGKRPLYRLIDDSELMLTLFAAPPPDLD